MGDQEFPYSHLELSKPTGKYVSRVILKCVNLLSAKGFIRFTGNACSPGLQFPKIPNMEKKDSQNSNNCGVIVANILGNSSIPNAVTILAEPFMNLHLRKNWQTFNDYLDAMSSKYRVKTKKVFTQSDDYHRTELDLGQANDWIPQCAQMLGHTLKDKTLAISPNLSAMLHTFVSTLKDNFKVWGYYQNEHLIGFISAIRSKEGIYAMHLGLTDTASDNQLYQRMMYDIIGYGIEEKVEFVCLGRTATEIKSTMGAIPVENSFIFITKSKPIYWALRFYQKYFHKTKNYQLRNPFK